MSSIELTFVIPIILVIIIVIIVASYFIAQLIDLELFASARFLFEVLNKSESEPSNSVFKEETYRSMDRFIFSPMRNNDSQSGLAVKSEHHLIRIRRIWLLLTSFVYEGGVDYFNEEK